MITALCLFAVVVMLAMIGYTLDARLTRIATTLDQIAKELKK